jgi:hypothetical protein
VVVGQVVRHFDGKIIGSLHLLSLLFESCHARFVGQNLVPYDT